MTKRLTAIFLAVLAVLTLAACGQGETAPGTMGTMLAQVFEERGKADPNLDLTDLGNTLMNDSGLPIDGEVTPVEPGLLMGFGNDEITGFAEGVMFAPVISTIPFVGYLFRLDAGTDGDAFVQTLKDQANPRWNICITFSRWWWASPACCPGGRPTRPATGFCWGPACFSAFGPGGGCLPGRLCLW